MPMSKYLPTLSTSAPLNSKWDVPPRFPLTLTDEQYQMENGTPGAVRKALTLERIGRISTAVDNFKGDEET